MSYPTSDEEIEAVDLTTRGALVISLDFELHWGVRDVYPAESVYTRNLLGAREAIPRILSLFEEFEVSATWATVGFLFAEHRDELLEVAPQLRPSYQRRELNPYYEAIGWNETDDPLHFAPSLIRRIATTPRQEIGSHTFSHYYCLESGQDAEAFRSDLLSAVEIAQRRGITLKSLILPRNQINPSYASIAADAGFTSFRGAQSGWIYSDDPSRMRSSKRAARLVDTYVGVLSPSTFSWDELSNDPRLCNVRASSFVRPFNASLRRLELLRIRHLQAAIRKAATGRELVHLWWHPHNFGSNTDLNLSMLRELLEEFRRCRARDGMRSLSMGQVAEASRRKLAGPRDRL